MTYRVLVVDDETTLRHFLSLHLQEQGYLVSQAADGRTALELLDRLAFDVVLLDLRLTDMHGLEILRRVRQLSPRTSIIIMTAYATLDSAIEALRQGAHDYVTKPFETTELLASVADSIARQSAQPPEPAEAQPAILEIKNLRLNRTNREVTRNNQAISLTPTEFDILAALMAQPDVAMDAITLVKHVRGYEATEADARAIARVHIHRLRHKLELDPAAPQYVTTVAGGRYLFSSR